MTLAVGFHYLADDDHQPPLAVATFLDVAGAGAGMRSPERLCRPYFKGVPDYESLVAKVLEWTNRGARVQIANEPNLPSEGWSGGVENLCMLFEQLAHDQRIWPDPYPRRARLYWPGMSPGVPGWEEWVRGPWAMDGIAAADGVVVHAYGTFDQMRATVQVYLDALRRTPLWIAECNFGAGQQVDRDRWADEHLRPFLDWCATVPQIEAVTYFAHRWPSADMRLPTPVDAAGTAIERVIREWRPPQTAQTHPIERAPKEPTVAQLRGIDLSSFQGAVDFDQVAAAGYRFAWIKATEAHGGGSVYRNPFFLRSWSEAKRVGMVRGAYLYAQPDEASPEETVRAFEQMLADAGGLEPGDLIALDAEEGSGDLLRWVAETCDLLERATGCTAVLYSGDWFLSAHNLEDHAPSLGRYPLWLASYQTAPPPVPAGWDKFTIWQFSDHGQIPGVGNCDVDVFLGDEEDLRALGKPAPASGEGVTPSSEPSTHSSAPPAVDPIDDALNNLFDLSLQTEPQSEGRRRSAQVAIDVLKRALGKEAA